MPPAAGISAHVTAGEGHTQGALRHLQAAEVGGDGNAEVLPCHGAGEGSEGLLAFGNEPGVEVLAVVDGDESGAEGLLAPEEQVGGRQWGRHCGWLEQCDWVCMIVVGMRCWNCRKQGNWSGGV